jgi:predicted RNase H-like nuclease (RuvC/YqgF family)
MSKYLILGEEFIREFYDTTTNSYAVPTSVVSNESTGELRSKNAKLKDELEKAEKRVSDLEDELARRDAVIEALKSKNERLKSMVQLFGTY